MKPCLTVLFLLAAGLVCAQQPEWLEQCRTAGDDVLQQMAQVRTATDESIQAMGDDCVAEVPADADDSLPEAEEGRAVAVADGGILYDQSAARLVYLGNVRIREAHLQIRCRNRLYLQFPKSVLHGHSDKPLDTLAQPEQEKATSKAEAAAPDVPYLEGIGEMLEVSAYDAMVDSAGNNILLRSNGAEYIPHIKSGTNELVLEPMPDGSDSYILADRNGDIHLAAGKATLTWTDDQGRPGSLVVEGGRLDFHRENNTLYIAGVSALHMPDGSTLTCKESLCVTLRPAPGAESGKQGAFFAQFTSMHFDGIDKAVARGDVQATRPAAAGQPAASVSADALAYDGKTGECSLTGKDCALAYGPQTIHTQEGITLSPNGDITIHGSEITGTYALPSTATKGGEAAEATEGTFRTKGDLVFRAEDGTVTFPAGLHVEDAANHLICTGRVTVRLKRTREPKAGRQGAAMLNLAIADYGDVSSVEAEGGVDIHFTDAAKGQALDLQGSHVNFDVDKGTAKITAGPGQTARLAYGAYTITTQAEGAAYMSVDEHGDIDVQGDTIHADLPFQRDHAVVDCCSHLKLVHATGSMEMGAHSELTYPGGVMTANGPVSAKLAPGEEGAKPLIERYPHLSYNFSGVEHAETQEGGTLRTEKASMECTGLISVTIAPPSGDKGKKDAISRVQAVAQGDVAILAKDNTGRLIRAVGDTLTLDGATGVKKLTGQKVTLSDSRNTHTASGKGASVTIDRNNSARITGERQVSYATGLLDQKDDGKTSKPTKKKN